MSSTFHAVLFLCLASSVAGCAHQSVVESAGDARQPSAIGKDYLCEEQAGAPTTKPAVLLRPEKDGLKVWQENSANTVRFRLEGSERPGKSTTMYEKTYVAEDRNNGHVFFENPAAGYVSTIQTLIISGHWNVVSVNINYVSATNTDTRWTRTFTCHPR